MSVATNLQQILKKIAVAAQQSGRDPASIKLLAVSKTHPPQKILAAYQEGQRLFGENYVQEALPKMDQLTSQSVEWHFIGALQSNKAKQVVGRFALIHSVDRLSLAEEISKRAVEKKCTQPILLQVNIGEEASKGGVAAEDLFHLAEQVMALPGLRVDGLMAMPPLTTAPDVARGYFRQTHDLLVQLRKKMRLADLTTHPLTVLSMGTSADFAEAIAEGSTMVRIGTDIFGPREDKA